MKESSLHKIKNILILGGTGAIGKHVVNLLKDTNYTVYVTSRSIHQSSGNIHYIHGNAIDYYFILTLLKESFYEAIIDFMAYKTIEFEKILPSLLSSTKQYIYLSSARCYSNQDKIITESTPRLIDIIKDPEYLATNEYALEKGKQENLLFNSISKNWTIIRPYITYSEDRLQLGVYEKEDWLYRALKGRTILFSQDIASKFTTLTYGKDVAASIIKLIGNPAALGEAFHITSNDSFLWQDILRIYATELESMTKNKIKVLMQKESTNLNIPSKKWQVIYDRKFDRYFDNKKIHKATENLPLISTTEGLTECLHKFVMNPKFKDIDWKKQAMFDKITKEVASFSEMQTLKEKIIYFIYRYIIY